MCFLRLQLIFTIFGMYRTYFKLKHADITVQCVKIDAFTIKDEDEKNPREWLLLTKLEAGE